MADDGSGIDLARAYYAHVDAGDYDALADLLAPAFTHCRPDRTLAGRERFVAFMREERPDSDTSHEVAAVYTGAEGVAAQGRLLRADGSEWFRFVDVFAVGDGVLDALWTYTN